MTFSAVICADLLSLYSNHDSKVCSSRLIRKHRLASATPKARGNFNLKFTVSSVLGNKKPSINDNGAAEPTRFLLENLFSKTQQLEEQMSQDSQFTEDILIGLDLENLESDLRAALAVLKTKEETLHDAEKVVLLEHAELEHAKEDLKRWEKEILVIAHEQEQLQDALNDANLNLASKTRQIEDLKLQIKERDFYAASVQLVLNSKQYELDCMRDELVVKSEDLTCKNFELETKSCLLDEANEVIQKQNDEIQELHRMVQENQRELEVSSELRTRDEEKLKISENNLKNQTREYLIAHEEVKRIAEETSRNFKETNKTLTDFERVKKLLANVRSELVLSQKSLSLCREHMKSHELLLEGQLVKLEEQKASIMSYFRSLKNAHAEVESEWVQFRVAVARNKELEDDLSVKKKIAKKLEDELKIEKVRLEQAIRDKCVLKEELGVKNKELEEAHSRLRLKDSELEVAKLEIQRLLSQQNLLNQILNEKDGEILSASKLLEEMCNEVAELKILVLSKEDQLVQASNISKEKDAHLKVMQHELHYSKLKYGDAERIVDLTNEFVVSTKSGSEVRVLQNSDTLFSKSELESRQLEAEIALEREDLMTRENEVLASQRALAIEDEELNLVCEKLYFKEEEIKIAKEIIAREADELKKLPSLSQERIGETIIGAFAIEKLQHESTQLEAEAATSALAELAELSRELLSTSIWFSEAEVTTSALAEHLVETVRGRNSSAISDCTNSAGDGCNEFVDLTGVKTEVARLVSLTEELMHEAGLAWAVCRL